LRGALEALQGLFDAGRDCFRAKFFEKLTPPAWREDEISAICDAAGGRIDGVAGNMGLLLQPQWKKGMQVELVSFGIDRFDLEGEAQGAAKDLATEGAGLAGGGWTFWLNAFCLDIGPVKKSAGFTLGPTSASTGARREDSVPSCARRVAEGRASFARV
jgi:hypothetical protein